MDGNIDFDELDRQARALGVKLPKATKKPKIAPVKNPFDDFIQDSASRHGVDPDLIRAMTKQESSFRSNAVSPKNAQGLMQLIPATARRFGVTDTFDPKQNIEGGTKYIKWLLNRYNGDVNKALAGYNAGEGAVDRYKGIPPYRETQDYVKRITSNYKGNGYLSSQTNTPSVDFDKLDAQYAKLTGKKPSEIVATQEQAVNFDDLDNQYKELTGRHPSEIVTQPTQVPPTLPPVNPQGAMTPPIVPTVDDLVKNQMPSNEVEQPQIATIEPTLPQPSQIPQVAPTVQTPQPVQPTQPNIQANLPQTQQPVQNQQVPLNVPIQQNVRPQTKPQNVSQPLSTSQPEPMFQDEKRELRYTGEKTQAGFEKFVRQETERTILEKVPGAIAADVDAALGDAKLTAKYNPEIADTTVTTPKALLESVAVARDKRIAGKKATIANLIASNANLTDLPYDDLEKQGITFNDVLKEFQNPSDDLMAQAKVKRDVVSQANNQIEKIQALASTGQISQDEADRQIAEENQSRAKLQKQLNNHLQRGTEVPGLLDPTDEQTTDVDTYLKENGAFSAKDFLDQQERERKANLEAWKKIAANPNAAATEFLTNLGRTIPKTVSALSKAVSIGAEGAEYLFGQDGTDAKDKAFYQFGKWLDRQTDAFLPQDPVLKRNFLVTTLPDTLGQLFVQVGAGAVTGGLTAPLLIGATQGGVGQYEDAEKFAGTKDQRLLAALTGSIAAIPDVFLQAKWLKLVPRIEQPKLFGTFINSFFGNTVKELGEQEATTITKQLLKNMLVGGVFEGTQEVSENKINDFVASLTYDKQRKVLTINDNDIESFIGGFIGGLGGGALETANTSDNYSEKEIAEKTKEEVLDKIKQYEVTVKGEEILQPITAPEPKVETPPTVTKDAEQIAEITPPKVEKTRSKVEEAKQEVKADEKLNEKTETPILKPTAQMDEKPLVSTPNVESKDVAPEKVETPVENEPTKFYHGTSAETDFTSFKGDLAYLSPNKADASVFGTNEILSKGKKGKARVLDIEAKPGKVKDVADVVDEAIVSGDDIDKVIKLEARKARREGFRYLEFNHPSESGGADFKARISLFPKEDLTINTAKVETPKPTEVAPTTKVESKQTQTDKVETPSDKLQKIKEDAKKLVDADFSPQEKKQIEVLAKGLDKASTRNEFLKQKSVLETKIAEMESLPIGRQNSNTKAKYQRNIRIIDEGFKRYENKLAEKQVRQNEREKEQETVNQIANRAIEKLNDVADNVPEFDEIARKNLQKDIADILQYDKTRFESTSDKQLAKMASQALSPKQRNELKLKTETPKPTEVAPTTKESQFTEKDGWSDSNDFYDNKRLVEKSTDNRKYTIIEKDGKVRLDKFTFSENVDGERTGVFESSKSFKSIDAAKNFVEREIQRTQVKVKTPVKIAPTTKVESKQTQTQAQATGKVEKQPYEMTRDEFLGLKQGDYVFKSMPSNEYGFGEIYKKSNGETFKLVRQNDIGVPYFSPVKQGKTLQKEYTFADGKDIAHKLIVEKALKEGKTVPAEVLKDYPDLAKKYAETPSIEPDGYVKNRPVRILDTQGGKVKVQFLDGKKETSTVLKSAVKPVEKPSKVEAQTETDNNIETLPISERVTPEDLGDTEFTRKRVSDSVKKEKVRQKTGFTKTQTEWFVSELQKHFDTLPAQNETGLRNELTELKKKKSDLRNARTNVAARRFPIENRISEIEKTLETFQKTEPVVIDIPGDGEFKFYSQQGLNRIHKKLTGKTVTEFLEAQKTESVADKRLPARSDEVAQKESAKVEPQKPSPKETESAKSDVFENAFREVLGEDALAKAKESAKSAVSETSKGLSSATKGLGKLFAPDKFKGGGFPAFDEKTYAEAKPFFEEAFTHFKQAGKDIAETIKALITHLKESGFSDADIFGMRPYIEKFAEESANQTPKVETPKVKESAPVEAERVETAPETAVEPESVTSTKNAVVDEERIARGLEPMMKPLVRQWGTAANEAIAKMDADSTYQDKLVNELLNKPRTVSDSENFAILHKKVTLRNESQRTDADIIKAFEAGDTFKQAQLEAHAKFISDALLDIDTVTKKVGTELGRGLAARKMMMKDDYSFAALETKKRVALGGRELTDIERDGLRKTVADLEKANADLEARLSTQEDRNAQMRAERQATAIIKEVHGIDPIVMGMAERIVAKIDARADAARERLRKRGIIMSAGINPKDLADLVEIGASHIAHLGLDFVKWSGKMMDEFGEAIKPHLDDIYDAAQKGINKVVPGKIKARVIKPKVDKTASITERIKAKFDDGNSDVAGLVQQLARQFVENGVTKRGDLIDKVHEVLQSIDPEITKRETMDAISGYGKFSQLSKDEVSVTLRDLKGQMQQIAKIEDMQAGKAPAKTGLERRTPSDEERRLIKQVEEAKRKGNYVVTDPATQLRTTLQTAKTRLSNQITDLTDAINNKTAIVTAKTKSPTSPEIEALKKTRDDLKSQYDALFPKVKTKTPLTDEQRIKMATKAVETSIANLKERIRTNAIAPQTRTSKTPVTPELKALQAERDVLQSILKDLRAQADPKVSPEERALAAWKTRTANKIAELEDKLANKDFAPTTRPRKEIAFDEEASKLQYDIAKIKRDFDLALAKDRRSNSLKLQMVYGYKTFMDFFRNLTFSGEMSYQMRQAGKFVRANAVRSTFRRLKPYQTILENNGIVVKQKAPESLVTAQTKGLTALMSHEGFLRAANEIEQHPVFSESEQMGVQYSNAGKLETSQHRGEEELQSEGVALGREWLKGRTSLIGKTAAFLPKSYLGIVERFDAAMGITLDTIRVAMYDRLRTDLINQGFDPKTDRAEFEELAKRINTGTGRPNKFKNYKAQAFTDFIRESRIFGSPSYTVSKWQDLSADVTATTSTVGKTLVRRELPLGTQRLVARDALMSYSALMLKYSLIATSIGALISLDPDDDDFLKLRVPGSDFRYDLTSGNRSELKLIGQFVKRGMENAGVIKPKGTTVGQNFINYNTYKLHNVIQFGKGAVTGKDTIGKEFSLKDPSRWFGLVAPMTWVEAGKITANYGILSGMDSGAKQFFGYGVSAYPDRQKELEQQIKDAEESGDTEQVERLKKIMADEKKSAADKRAEKKKETPAKEEKSPAEKKADAIKKRIENKLRPKVPRSR